MLNYNKIEELLKKLKITKKELLENLEMSNQGYIDMVKDRTMKVKTLEKLSEFLGVPESYFFDEEDEDDQKNLMSEDRERYYLIRQLDKKDKQIDFLQNYIIHSQYKTNEQKSQKHHNDKSDG